MRPEVSVASVSTTVICGDSSKMGRSFDDPWKLKDLSSQIPTESFLFANQPSQATPFPPITPLHLHLLRHAHSVINSAILTTNRIHATPFPPITPLYLRQLHHANSVSGAILLTNRVRLRHFRQSRHYIYANCATPIPLSTAPFCQPSMLCFFLQPTVPRHFRRYLMLHSQNRLSQLLFTLRRRLSSTLFLSASHKAFKCPFYLFSSFAVAFHTFQYDLSHFFRSCILFFLLSVSQ